MTDDIAGFDLRNLLKQRVGGFFTNTITLPGQTCEVCSGPGKGLCGPCRQHRGQYGAALADRVLTLTYARGNALHLHQSAYTMMAYKQTPPSQKAADDLALMVLAATSIHKRCIAAAAGQPVGAVTFVPSITRPDASHPAAGLARYAVGLTADQRFGLALGPRAHDASRTVWPDRFVVDGEWRERVRGEHSLIVDDTWTTGSKAQSAALAARAAGAKYVTILCIARWCRYDWPDHRALLDHCASPYDAFVCPVTRGPCAQ